MAQRRMFSMQIVDTDAFVDMPQTAQLLYFHLAMRADDDGFVGSPKKIMRMVGSQDDDYKILIAKRFILQFDSGICVVKHWRIHNYIQSDRYKETAYLKEKEQLFIKENGAYTECIQNVSIPETQVRLGKVRQGKVSLEGEVISTTQKKQLTPGEEMIKFISDKKYQLEIIESFVKEGYSKEMLLNETITFINYWTELMKSGKRQKWELQQTFELKRRLSTWFKNVLKFNSKKTVPDVDYKQISNELLARRRENAIKSCGKCKNGFIYKEGVMTYCDCVKNLK